MRLPDTGASAPAAPTTTSRAAFESILYRTRADAEARAPVDPSVLRDLHVDQIVSAAVTGRERYDLTSFLHLPLRDVDAVVYRQEVMRDLENDRLMQAIAAFASGIVEMHRRLDQATKLHHERQIQRWFLGAAQAYCDATEGLHAALALLAPASRGMSGFREYLGGYVASASYRELASTVRSVASALAAIRYDLLILGNAITVRAHEDAADYSAQVEATFAKFRRRTAQDYRTKLTTWPDANHVEGQILDRVARLNPEAFGALLAFFDGHQEFIDAGLTRFDREIQFYVAVLAYLGKLRRAGLEFCYPTLSSRSKAVRATSTFDVALAARLVVDRATVVRNDLELTGRERIFVVTGPNQGGKTTFARTFGQLHYLASLGCPVAGVEAHLFLFDRMFTHFEREEVVESLRGKLQDELIRMRDILEHATAQSIVIMNEVFSSTTVADAVLLGRAIMERLTRLDVLGACVTFLGELASFDEKTVSVVSTVDPSDPAVRTFRVVRRGADGLAYALAIAEKYRITYAHLLERIPP